MDSPLRLRCLPAETENSSGVLVSDGADVRSKNVMDHPSPFQYRFYRPIWPRDLDSWKTVLIVVRAWSLSASLSPVILGTVLAFTDGGQISYFLSVLVLVCVVSVHCAGNLVNSYYDFRKGVDSSNSDDVSLVNKLVSTDFVVRLGVLSYAVACAAFIVLLMLSYAKREQLALLFFIGLSGSFLYTGSFGLKYYALGDLVVMLAFGPVSVLFSYIVQTGTLSLKPLLYSIPIVMNTEAILHGNNSRDRESDMKAGILTLAIVLGKGFSYVLYIALLFLPYQAMIFLAVTKSWHFVFPLLTFPLAFKLERRFRSGDVEKIPQQTAELNLAFSSLYVLSFLLSTK